MKGDTWILKLYYCSPNVFQIFRIPFFRKENCLNSKIFQVFIDSNGDAEGNYSVIALMEDFTMNDTFKMSMQPVGFFQYNTSSNVPHLPVSWGIYISFTLMSSYVEITELHIYF